MINAVIFDLDGTLSYTLDSIAVSGNLALESIGMPPYEKDRYKYFCGDGVDELVRRALYNNGDTEYEHFNELKSAYMKFFEEYAEYNVKPYDGMVETVKAIKKQGIKVCVLSNKPHEQTIQVVEKLYGKGCFDYIQGNTPLIPRKPASDGAFIISENIGIAPENILYVGDTATDMQTGNGANMHTVGVLWGYRTRQELMENHAEHIIERPEQLLDLIEEI